MSAHEMQHIGDPKGMWSERRIATKRAVPYVYYGTSFCGKSAPASTLPTSFNMYVEYCPLCFDAARNGGQVPAIRPLTEADTRR